jgi:DNA-binding MarR family transcriptional regulator
MNIVNASPGNSSAVRIQRADGNHLLDDCACLQLRMASRAITRFFDEILEPSGLRATQFSILAAIDGGESLTVTKLAADLVMDSSTVVRNLKPLERAGLIIIAADKDRRRKIVRLTPKGLVKLVGAVPLWHMAHDRLRGLMGVEMLENNGDNLKRLVSGILELGKATDERKGTPAVSLNAAASRNIAG